MARRPGLRSYPVVGYVAAAVLLAVLLPSGLNLPNSGPPTVAEYAPVPGTGQRAGNEGNLGTAGGNGLGSGGSGPGASAGSSTPGNGGPPVGPNNPLSPPNHYRCVRQADGVWHQTEDPLSPPCITFGPNDNGGPTGAPGVSADEIRVAVELPANSTTSQSARDWLDCNQSIDFSVDRIDEIECKAFQQFFNDRYFTYHRRVHVFGVHNLSPDDIVERLHPFAAVNPVGVFGTSFPAHQVMAISFDGGDRTADEANAPYMLSFWPDRQDEADLAASYICQRLGHRTAQTTDPALRKPRKYGYWSENQQLGAYDTAVIEALRSRCGIDVSHDVVYGVSNPQFAAKLEADGVTTVLVHVNTGTLPIITGFASKAAYFPEWVVPGAPDVPSIANNAYGRAADPTEWRQAIGITFDYRRDAERQQQWYRAYKEACPQCPDPDGRTAYSQQGAQLYDTFQLLFTGIQLGGPRLTAQTIDRGLHAIPETPSPTPYRPAAYLRPGNYSFIKDAMAIWWDPQGTTPDAGAPGCYRLVEAGRRHRAGEWPSGDRGVRGNARDPCQGDAIPGS
jgi:hypothetical protein